MITGIYNRMIAAFARKKKQKVPRTIKMRTFGKSECKFEISTPIEAFRVEQYGGEEEFTRLILEEVKPDDVFLDIGSCIGLVTIHAAKKGALVYAFEPDPYYRSRLTNNVKLNGLANVNIIEWAVSDSHGEVTLFTDGKGGNSPSLREIGERGSVIIKTDTLDNALMRGEMPIPDVLKMDIEGAEILALKGMEKLLNSSERPRTIFLEIHPAFLGDFKSSMEEVEEILVKAGYVEEQKTVRSNELHCIYRVKA